MKSEGMRRETVEANEPEHWIARGVKRVVIWSFIIAIFTPLAPRFTLLVIDETLLGNRLPEWLKHDPFDNEQVIS